MGIAKDMKAGWKRMNTAGKINLVLDILCGFGAATISGRLMKKMAPEMNRVERICAGIVMNGLSIAAGSVAANAFSPYTEGIGKVIDAAKEKEEEETEEEDE